MSICQKAAKSLQHSAAKTVRRVICQCERTRLQYLPAADFYLELNRFYQADNSTKTCGVSGELTVLVEARPRANVVGIPPEPEKPKTCSACVNKIECNLLLDSDHLRTCRWNYQAKQCENIPDDYHKLTATYEQVPQESESEKTKQTKQLQEIHKKQEEYLNLGRCGGKPQPSCENTINGLRDCRSFPQRSDNKCFRSKMTDASDLLRNTFCGSGWTRTSGGSPVKLINSSFYFGIFHVALKLTKNWANRNGTAFSLVDVTNLSSTS